MLARSLARVIPKCGVLPIVSRTFADAAKSGEKSYMLMHPVYDEEALKVNITHRPPEGLRDSFVLGLLKGARFLFDKGTGYGGEMNEKFYLRRFLFLETVAGVPGMVGGMLRHLRSLRTMKRDNGRIHTLLEEAENERMHLLTFLEMKKPGLMFRAAVMGAQGVFLGAYTLSYILSSRSCHRFVGYLEEEAVKTYTRAIDDLDSGKLPAWENLPAPEIGVDYWKLKDGALIRDLLLAIRADEAVHRYVNHTFGSLKVTDPNPFEVGAIEHD